jgi:branched-chain amino acid transport system permease protein
VLEVLQQYLTQSVSGTGTYLIAYGVLFLAVILLLPRGVIPTVSEFVASRRAKGQQRSDRAVDAAPRGGVAGVAR